jgi:hypothetical protein
MNFLLIHRDLIKAIKSISSSFNWFSIKSKLKWLN